jgi:flagellar basal body P-ring formation protein FlgA
MSTLPVALVSRIKIVAATLSVASFAVPTALFSAQADNPVDVTAVRQFVMRQLDPKVGKVSLSLGEADPRSQLAPCLAAEPYLPPGAKLWGRTHIGIRCTQGARWQILVPLTVTIHGRALVARRALSAGAQLFAEDFVLQDAELTRDPGSPVRDERMLTGAALSRPISAGEVLRTEYMKQFNLVNAGDPVKVRLVGNGFTVSSEGVALAAASQGSALRVRMDSGRVVIGLFRDRVVELTP